MAPTRTHTLHARFSGVSWWLSEVGLGVRCAIIVGVIVFLLCLLWLGRWHAERRVKRGLKPLWYHAWLAPRTDPPPGAPQYGEPGYTAYRNGGSASGAATASVWRRQGDDGTENIGSTELAGLPPYSMDVPPAYKPVVKVTADGELRRDGVVVRAIEETVEGEGADANANANANAHVANASETPTRL